MSESDQTNALKDAAMADIRAVEAVLRRWDPINVEPGFAAPADEYDRYAPQLVSMVRNGASLDELTAHLEYIAVETMSLGPSTAKSREWSRGIAAEIIAIVRRIDHMPDHAYRESICKLLAAVSGLEQSLGPVELIEMWFSDLYFPGHRRPDDYSEVVWGRGQAEWRECFSAQELATLERFDQVFDKEVQGLSTDWSTWRTDEAWLRVSAAARVALREMTDARPDAPSDERA